METVCNKPDGGIVNIFDAVQKAVKWIPD